MGSLFGEELLEQFDCEYLKELLKTLLMRKSKWQYVFYTVDREVQAQKSI